MLRAAAGAWPSSTAALAILVLGFSASSGSAGGRSPGDITARYRLSFNGLEVGTYDFRSKVAANGYEASSGTKISALFGAFTWKGSISGSGTLEGQTPHPASYEMTYKSNSKQYRTTIAFDGSKVSSVTLQPSKPPKPDAVKLKPEHMQNVYDPMAALMAISNTSAADACNRTIPVFDGKSRADLKLSPKGRETVKDKRPTGQPNELLVCRVKYIPIAGHQPKDFENPWVEYGNIEIALRPIPSAGIFVPYRIKIPTTIGPIAAIAEEINIKTADDVKIALKQ